MKVIQKIFRSMSQLQSIGATGVTTANSRFRDLLGYAGIPGKPSTQTGFGALSHRTSPPPGLLGVGLGGDSPPRMIAFQARLEF